MKDATASDRFYERLQSFADFEDLTNDRHFVPVPADWFVVITDVKGSTRAIEAGRYKDVNTIGAASISVVQEALKTEFPYVFGGDGATLLVPAQVIDRVLDPLTRLQNLSRSRFNIELRVGRIAVKEICESGVSLEVAKHELAKGKCVAVFRGGGLSEAERRIKGNEARYCCVAEQAEALELTGLSCRWNPIPNQRGCILSLLVLSRAERPAEVYQRFLAELNRVFDGHLDEANPVNTGLMSYKTVQAAVAEEARYHPAWWTPGFFKRLIEIVASVLVFKYRLPPVLFNAQHYRESMRVHSDYRKFDDMLRMVIDCSIEQAGRIRLYLEREHEAGRLCYGIHTSEHALMTCYVQDVKDGEHIHFIDGSDGGYALAAKQLKRQMEQAG